MHGTKGMANNFLNCGNVVLPEAAWKWVESRGGKDIAGGSGDGPRWGRLEEENSWVAKR